MTTTSFPLAAAANENLADISNYLVYSAMAVYTLAFVAYIAEWAFGSRSRIALTSAALTRTPAGAASAEGAAPGVTVQVKQGAGTTVLARPAVVTRPGPGGRDVEDGPGASGESEQGDLSGRIAISLTALAFLLHAGAVVSRGLSVQRAPWGNMFEFSTTFSMVIVGAYLILLALKKNVRWIGLPLVTTVLLDLGLAVAVLYTDSDQLVPALDSVWLWIHVSLAICCGALFYVGMVATVLYLFRDRYEAKLADPSGPQPGAFARSVLARVPSAGSLDKFAYRINAAVFPFWTFTIVAGAIWAENAWGRYWGWDPKEVWSFITWVAYACYLHARATAGWKGRKAAYLAIVAFLCFLFNYYGVNLFVSGLHSYSGV
ncbi:c-type cytochrome biogenesis protein CcsB [Streptomyces polyrhachis]|uniref:C-type cytochrome biogenesis protein CcsB n=1 Tax=Streptomyces polyrhachis TaxID=1282885 RepID=A0ABW2GN31_9ACTN